MIKTQVLIAEDEPLVARFLNQTIEAVEGVEVVAVCKSGEEACQYINNLPVQILVTDIHMHGMSGLELISEAKKVKPGLQVIVVSGYGLFEYAKEALRLGVEDYLLKPIDPEELAASIREMQAVLVRQHNEKINNALKKLLRAEKYEKIGTLIKADEYNIMFVSQSGDPENTLELCYNGVSELEDCTIYAAPWNHSVFLIAPAEGSKDVFEPLRRWIRSRAETNTLELLYTDSPISGDELPKHLQKLYRISREDRILGKTVEHVISVKNGYPSVKRRNVNTFPEEVLSGKRETMAAAFGRLFSEWERERFSVRELRAALFALLEQVNVLYSVSDSLPAASDAIAECIKYADSFSDARDASWSIIDSVINSAKKVSDDTKIDLRSLFEDIDQFLSNNCSQNYSLQAIARQFHVSQPYISRAFRTYADMTYKEYCVQKKIDLAKMLIATQPNKMLKDIASQVGIDPAYFGTVFHRVTGEYPSEFKMKQEGGAE